VTNGGAASNLDIFVAGTSIATQGQAATGASYSVNGIIPAGATYKATISSGGTLNNWTEVY
jgi:hypothetical protein